jgi:hypothetical protein
VTKQSRAEDKTTSQLDAVELNRAANTSLAVAIGLAALAAGGAVFGLAAAVLQGSES